MALTFTRVPEVATGDPITSTHAAKIADAINDRLRSGLGDGAKRICIYIHNQFKQIRNPDASGFLYPSQAEFLEVYQHVHPSQSVYPLTGPGEPEGTNVACVMGAFVFGSEADDAYPEDIRVADPEFGGVPIEEASANLQKWELAKRQRGTWDPTTGAMASPSFTAARSYFSIIRSTFGPHGNAYGGFLPTPDLATPDNCSDGTVDVPDTPSYVIKFTSLVDGVADKTYPGTCAGEPGHVVGIWYGPDEYVVVSNDGSGDPTIVEHLKLNEWLEGPYTGPSVLRRTPGQFLQRAMNYFAAQFRGSDAQRIGPGRWNQYAFDFQEFIQSQYILAPARGQDMGGGIVTPYYPALWLYGALSFTAGTRGYLRGGGSARDYVVTDGHVIASCLVAVQKLVGSVTVQIYADDVLIRTATVTADADGNASELIVFSTPIPAGAVIYTRLDSALSLSDVSSSAGLIVEFAELMAYKPLAHDIYLVLRAGGCRVETANGTDGVGFDEVNAREIGENLTRYGVLLNVNSSPGPAGSEAEINTNAVFESARRLSKCVRILRRHHLVGYEVADGKSILYFRRFALDSGEGISFDPSAPPVEYEVADGDLVPGQSYLVTGTTPGADYVTHDGSDYDPTTVFKATSANYTAFGDAKVYVLQRHVIGSGTTGGLDAFDGVAPSRYPVGSADIEIGRSYTVRGSIGYATYNGTNYAPGQTFVGISGTNTLTTSGDATVYESDGIRSTATQASFTNEWLIGFDWKVYRDQETSPFKPEAFSDWAPFSDRCQFYQDWNAVSLNAHAKRHFAYGSKVWTFPEAVTGYRYSFNLNRQVCDPMDTPCIEARNRNYKSCRIYEPFVEIEKTEILIEGGEEIVKCTLTGRLHHHEDADATIDRDYTTWDRPAIHSQDYRTDENAVQEYIIKQAYGENCQGGEDHAGVQTGNSAVRSAVWDLPSPPFGACFPSIYMVKLLPKPYIDDNDRQDPTDTPYLHDQLLIGELYLRVMCEGYVDGTTSELYGCSTGLFTLYDYSFENLCLDAFQGRWFQSLASEATSRIPASSIREDRPQGFGPLPNTISSSEIFNQYAKALNKLTKVRVDIPFLLEAQDWRGASEISVNNVVASSGGNLDCPGNVGPPGALWSGIAPDADANILDADWHALSLPGSVGSSVVSGFPIDTSPPNRFLCDGTNWIVQTIRLDQTYRIVPDQGIELAFQPAWSDMVQTSGGFLAQITESVNPLTFELGDVTAGTKCGGDAVPHWITAGADYMVFTADATFYEFERCAVVIAGRMHAQPVPGSNVTGCYRSEVANQSFSSGPGTSIVMQIQDGNTPFIEVPLS